MQLFTLCPDAYDKNSHRTYQPKKGISLRVVRNVLPCFTNDDYAWVTEAISAKGIDPAFHILPIILTESTKNELRVRRQEEPYSWSLSNPLLINYASLQKGSDGVRFLKQEESSEDQNVLVSLELPLSAAQPYYEFEGDVEVVLGIYATYYGKPNSTSYEVEKENALCSAIVKMGNKAKVTLTYTNRYRQGQIIENLVGYKFEFICSSGQLVRLDDCNFHNLYSGFMLDED